MRDVSHCFACGPDNPIGLHLRFADDGGRLRAEFTPGRQYEGYAGVLPGGIIAAALVDAMANLLHRRGREALTARLRVRYLKEAPIGARLVVTAGLIGERGRVYTAEARLELPDGTRLAEGRGTFVRTG